VMSWLNEASLRCKWSSLEQFDCAQLTKDQLRAVIRLNWASSSSSEKAQAHTLSSTALALDDASGSDEKEKDHSTPSPTPSDLISLPLAALQGRALLLWRANVIIAAALPFMLKLDSDSGAGAPKDEDSSLIYHRALLARCTKQSILFSLLKHSSEEANGGVEGENNEIIRDFLAEPDKRVAVNIR
jgi:hypothetical protein